jgi:hypothetical protein
LIIKELLLICTNLATLWICGKYDIAEKIIPVFQKRALSLVFGKLAGEVSRPELRALQVIPPTDPAGEIWPVQVKNCQQQTSMRKTAY